MASTHRPPEPFLGTAFATATLLSSSGLPLLHPAVPFAFDVIPEALLVLSLQSRHVDCQRSCGHKLCNIINVGSSHQPWSIHRYICTYRGAKGGQYSSLDDCAASQV